MDGERFDRWTRAFAPGRSRRRALRILAGTVLGFGVAGWRAAITEAQCNGFLCEGGGGGGATCCYPGQFCCPLDSGNETCCWPGTQVCDPTWTCRASCPAGRVKCGDFCCRAGEICSTQSMKCVAAPTCPSGRIRCGDACCQAGETCHPTAKTCFGGDPRVPTSGAGGPQGPTSFCGPGKTNCGGTCVDLNSNDQQCGQCGRACDPLYETCVNGACCPFSRGCGSTCCPPCHICDILDKTCRPCDQVCENCAGMNSECGTVGVTHPQTFPGVGAVCGKCSTCYLGKCRQNQIIMGKVPGFKGPICRV